MATHSLKGIVKGVKYTCTATGNLDHSLKQDCDTITILLKGEFRWRNAEDSPSRPEFGDYSSFFP